MPDVTPNTGSSVDLTNVEKNLKDISDNLGLGDQKLFIECAMRLFVNSDFSGRTNDLSPSQIAQQCIQNALTFVNTVNKAKNKYFK